MPLDGTVIIFCDNEAVYKNSVLPESLLSKNNHSIAYHRCRDAIAANTMQVSKEGTLSNLSDLFTKGMSSIRRLFLLDKFTY